MISRQGRVKLKPNQSKEMPVGLHDKWSCYLFVILCIPVANVITHEILLNYHKNVNKTSEICLGHLIDILNHFQMKYYVLL